MTSRIRVIISSITTELIKGDDILSFQYNIYESESPLSSDINKMLNKSTR